VRGETGGGGDLGGDVLPLLVGKDLVGGMIVDRAVPNRQAQRCPADPDGLFEQFGQPSHGWPAVGGG
jgi:hypothetical protein